jgi:hypothetical protein
MWPRAKGGQEGRNFPEIPPLGVAGGNGEGGGKGDFFFKVGDQKVIASPGGRLCVAAREEEGGTMVDWNKVAMRIIPIIISVVVIIVITHAAFSGLPSAEADAVPPAAISPHLRARMGLDHNRVSFIRVCVCVCFFNTVWLFRFPLRVCVL